MSKCVDAGNAAGSSEVGKAFLYAHADAVARNRQWRAERAARPMDPVQRARIDRELADQYPDIAEYLACDREIRQPFPACRIRFQPLSRKSAQCGWTWEMWTRPQR